MNLVLLSNGFPYGGWEAYLETEIKYYDAFDSVHLCAMQLRKEHAKKLRPLPSERFHVCPVPFAPLAVYFLEAFGALFDKNFWGELRRLIRERRFSLTRLAWLSFYVGRAHHEARIIRRYLEKAGLTAPAAELILYSYRFDYQPYAALLLKKRLPDCRLIVRAHRYDLYEEERGCRYIPMRPYLLERIDRVVLIAQDGLRYLAGKYPAYRDKLSVSLLGTVDHGACPAHMDGGPLHLISCSSFDAFKRVHLIPEALAQITDREVYWTHCGVGPLMDEVRALCAKLPENIHAELRGYVPNAELLKEYETTPYHLFLNVSSSEGIPVSIMEAMSFGTPCIATNVGGTGEIVNGENGILLPSDFAPAELASHIRAFAAMDDGEYQRRRAAARGFWQAHYSAEKNYPAFVKEYLCAPGTAADKEQ